MLATYRSIAFVTAAALSFLMLTGCRTAPKGQEAREILQDKARLTVREMQASDPSLEEFLNNRAHAYAVFPEVGKGGVLVGGAYGRGVVFRGDEFIGYVELNQASLGLQLGAKTFSEIMAFADEATLNELRNRGEFTVGANASAVAMKAGAAAAANFQDGVAVFVRPRGGLMADLSVNGQKINFQPAGGADNNSAAQNNDPGFRNNVNRQVQDPAK